MSWAAIGVTVAGAALSAGMSAAAANNAPQAPDLASSSAALSDLNAEMLPLRRQLEAAAQMGSRVTIDNYPEHQEVREFYDINPSDYGISSKRPRPGVFGLMGWLDREKTVRVPASDFDPGGQLANYARPSGETIKQKQTIPAGPRTFDFTGVGAADANAAVAKATAEAQLALQQKYGVAFAESNAEQAKLADPEGYAARQKMNELIQQQINTTPDRTIAKTLDSQIGDQLQAGSGLTAEEKAMLDQSVRSAGDARGGVDGSADFADPLTQGWAGEARQQAAIGKAGGWLASGLTPQDADYRREQTNLSNLSALVNGRSPTSQFNSLSAPGATPFTAGQALPQMPNNSTAGAQNAINTYGAQVNAAQQQVNPWMAGLSGLLSAASSWASNRKTT